MIVINKSVFCGNLDGARLLGHPVYRRITTMQELAKKYELFLKTNIKVKAPSVLITRQS